LRLLDYKRYAATLGTRYAWIDGPLRDKRSANRLERLYQRLMEPVPGFPAAYRDSWTYVHLWPSTYLDIYPDMIDVWHTMPVSLGRTRSEWLVLGHPREPRRNRLVRRVNMRINSLVMDEDVTLCDGVMRGLRSLTYERGVLNDNENAVFHFHEQLREHVPGIDDA
jgi:phenylpropionate dioxygenase-like ring-hydroxylating dioxygenase large terminal subunit